MAVINALKSGNWSDPSVWPNNTLPAQGDEVHANGFTITINTNVTVAELTTAAKNGGSAGGGFTLSNGVNVIANVTAGTTTCITAATSCLTASIAGNIVGGSVSGTYGLYVAGTTQVKINGNIVGGSVSGTYGLYVAGTTQVKINGNITGGASSAYGAYITSSANANINGIVAGGSASSAFGLYVISTSATNIVGEIIGGSGTNAYGAYVNSSAIINLKGNVTGGVVSNAHGLVAITTSMVNIIGNAYGGSGPSAYGVYAANAAVGMVTGKAIGGIGALAAGACGADAALITIDGSVEFGQTGQVPIAGNIRFKRRDSASFTVMTESGVMQLRPCPYTDQPVMNLPVPQVGQAVAWLKCLDQAGLPVAGISVMAQHIDGGKIGVVHTSLPLMAVSDSNGIAAFTLPRIAGLKYQLWVTAKSVKKLFVSEDMESYELPISLVTGH